jgi:anhydro-N-acetylmuramic acid kinase
LAELSGKPFDDGGKMASGGRLINSMLEQLNGLDHYKKNGPKSLGAEWVQEKITPLLENFLIQHSTQDVLRTFVEHAAIQIGKILNVNPGDTLITGGGVWNSYALECIREKSGSKLIIPDPMLVNYKEAIIFSLLGYLRIHNRTNVFYQYTGAKKNSITGGIYLS